MDMRMSRVAMMSAIVGTGLLTWAAAVGPTELLAQAQSTFMGGNPTQMPADKIRTLRLKFPKGSRSNWHSHSWGQLLMAEEGHGLTQDRGGPVKVISPGQPWFTKAGVEHWHGAAVDEDLVQLTIYEGEVKWLEPVTDAQYRVAPQR
jgi:quercetin dioxygenase-like cupin family protein